MKAVVSEKGQVTIPKKLRDSLGLRAGQVIDFEEGEPGQLIGRKVFDEHLFDKVYGMLGSQDLFGLSVDEFIDELRGPVPDFIKKGRSSAAS